MTKVIKRYKNRRLYDSELKKYITFEEVKEYVLERKAFKVIDNSSNEDITTNILMQLFVDLDVSQNNLLTNELLKQLIIYSDHPMNQAIGKLLSQTLTFFEQQYQSSPDLSETLTLFSKSWVAFSNQILEPFQNNSNTPEKK